MNDDQETLTNDVAPPEPVAETFKCKTCGREFSKPQALQTHEMRAHTKFWTTNPEGTRGPGKSAKHKRGAKVCPVCKKHFAKFYLTQHMRTQHGQSLREYRNGQAAVPAPSGPRMGRPRQTNKTCPVCKKMFGSRPNMTLHLRKVHKRSITEFQERGGRPLAQEAAQEREPTGDTARVIGAARKAARQKEEGREVIFCPVCGTNIHAVRTAVNFAEQ